MTMQQNTIVVSLGEIKTSRDPDVVLTCLGLGSCVGLCMHDPVAGVGGMAHIVLPLSDNGGRGGTKFADVAIPALLEELTQQGAVKSRLVTKVAGGSQMLKQGVNNFNTGQRNVEAAGKVLKSQEIPVSAADVGGTKGRSLRLFVGTRQVLVRQIGSKDVDL